MQLNQIACQGAGSTLNTGVADCYFVPGTIQAAIVVPRNFVVPKASYATSASLLTFFQNAIQAPRATRVFPISGFKELTNDNTGAPTKHTFGYGDTTTVREGFYDWTFRYMEGGLCLHNQLRKFNRGLWSAFFIDQNGVLIGTRGHVDGDLKGIPLTEVYTQPWKATNGTDPVSFLIEFVFHPKWINENVAFVDPAGEIDLSELRGLLNVKLSAKLSAGDVLVTANVSCGNANLFDIYPDELADESAWVAIDASGTPIAISTVVKDPATKGWKLTSTGGFVAGETVTLADPSVLSATPISVSGYEGLPATISA